LISQTGGNLGLFVGISIVTLLELLEFLLDVLLILISPSLYRISHWNPLKKFTTTANEKHGPMDKTYGYKRSDGELLKMIISMA